MTQEDKELLLKDLCARLPYGFKAHIINDGFYDIREPYDTNINIPNHHLLMDLYKDSGLIIQPYLRPMSSMTKEEEKEFQEIKLSYHFDEDSYILFDWLNAHHFDYRGLIEKGLALEAPEGMYK